MAEWKNQLDIADVWRDPDLSWQDQRDEIISRIRKAPWFDDFDFQLLDAVDGLSGAEDVQEFDGYWEDFYDWADANRVWIAR